MQFEPLKSTEQIEHRVQDVVEQWHDYNRNHCPEWGEIDEAMWNALHEFYTDYDRERFAQGMSASLLLAHFQRLKNQGWNLKALHLKQPDDGDGMEWHLTWPIRHDDE